MLASVLLAIALRTNIECAMNWNGPASGAQECPATSYTDLCECSECMTFKNLPPSPLGIDGIEIRGRLVGSTTPATKVAELACSWTDDDLPRKFCPASWCFLAGDEHAIAYSLHEYFIYTYTTAPNGTRTYGPPSDPVPYRTSPYLEWITR